MQLPVPPEEITAMASPPGPLAAPPPAMPCPGDSRVAAPDFPPVELPLAGPEPPVMQITVRAARMLTR